MLRFTKFDESYVKSLVDNLVERLPGKKAEDIAPVVIEVVRYLSHSSKAYQFKEEIANIGKHLYCLGFMPSTSGNISVRIDEDAVLVTPSGVCKGRINGNDILLINYSGGLLGSTQGIPSSEVKMHLSIYKDRKDVNAIVHCHPPFATSFATAGTSLDMPVLPEAVISLGKVPLVEYGTPSTWEIAEKIEPYAKNHNAFLLANHGALTLGKNLEEAALRMETLEFLAQVVYRARMLSGEKILDKKQTESLMAAFDLKK